MASNRHIIVLLLALMMGMPPAECDAHAPVHGDEHHHKAQYVGMGATVRDTAHHGRLKMLDKIRPILREYAEIHWAHYLPTLNSTNGTSCNDALETFYSFKNAQSFIMVDSWGKFPDGIVTRSPAVLGMYGQCLNRRHIVVGPLNTQNNIKGRYCLITVSRSRHHGQNHTASSFERTIDDAIPRIGQIDLIHPTEGYLQYGTCMPDACSEQQLKSSLSDVHGEHRRVSVHCNRDSITLDGVDIAFIVFCSVFLVLMLIGAALDYYIESTQNHQMKKGPLRFLLPFSVTTNLKKVFQINTKHNPSTISCLHAMRVLSMCWVIMGHQHMKLRSMKIYDYALIPKKIDTLFFQIIGNSTVSVDSFFFMSGLLVSYGVLREMKKTGKLNIVMFYVHRILRLTPPIAMCVWFYASVNRHMVSGPLDYGAGDLAERCRESGWRDIVYLSNAHWDSYEYHHSCMGQCWYTAVDTQLYLVAPLLIVPLHYFKDMGKMWLYIMTLMSVIIPGAITYRSMNSDEWLYVNETYSTPWCRANSWIVGIWIGYIIFKTGNNLKLKKWQVITGWTAACATAWMVLLGMYHVNKWESVTTMVIYNAFHRAAWAACLGWIAIACHNGYGGIVNGFLSHPAWQPVSRLTYGLYLVSFELQDDLVRYSRNNLFYYSPINMIVEIVAAMFLSGIGAVLLTLVAEAPVLGLEKLLFERPGHGPDEPAVKKLQEPTSNDNAAFLSEENELKQLSGVNGNGHGPDEPAVKKLQEPTSTDNAAFLSEENEQLSGVNGNGKTGENESAYNQSYIKE